MNSPEVPEQVKGSGEATVLGRSSCDDIAGRLAFIESLGQLLGFNGALTDQFLIVFDLDRFSLVNDLHGWEVGDRILSFVIQVIDQLDPREVHAAARIGNDEFALVTSGLKFPEVMTLVGYLRKRFACGPHLVEGVHHAIQASFGVVQITHDFPTVKELVSAAHLAQDISKEDGGDRTTVFSEASHRVQRKRLLMHWASRILNALDQNSFVLYEQPILALHSEESGIYEAKSEILVRLRSTDGSVILPGSFLPAAEKYSLMFAIDKWVFSHALDAWVRKRRRFGTAPKISINISSQSLMEPDLMPMLKAGFSRTGVPYSAVCFEFTESIAIRNFDEVVAVAAQLRSLGCSIALDDFGSGYATFDYLRRLPLDYLKIDGSIVEGIVHDEVNSSMVSGIRLVTEKMNLKTIGEFASSPSIVTKLRELGVNYGQGSSIAEPRPFEEEETYE